ncbi:MAG: polysaccharide pyruvyl transferase family protein [Spirochaetaceae bacterium]|jgi:hypothetical protein|nr:polysaccharide pyruvyl transferase family protein [Spirochaetaceae bacterium]
MGKYKFGVMTYRKDFDGEINVGDYIQSIAASTFLEKVDYYLEREGLDNYNMPEPIRIILNGWFMHSPDNWPPSDVLMPLFISFHITRYEYAALRMLSPAGIKYLKNHEPIGCRDYGTAKLLGKYGINAYFSGCLTLTLGRKYGTNVKTGNIYFVDVPVIGCREEKIKYLLKCIPKIAKHFSSVLRIYRKNKKSRRNIIYSFARACLFYCLYSGIFEKDVLIKAEYIKHSIDRETLESDRECFEYAESLLKKYASAKLVVTSRLHCALPCLGMGTPVIFINSEGLSGGRFDGLLELLRVFELSSNGFETEDDLLSKAGKIGFNTKIDNKKDFLKLREELERRCVEFIGLNT